ncbi:hypothetical protein [Brevibacterium oceani]|uniref:hypothetical protein n=1 Tax=Brevibacterium oceani TaxID=358099 RepID=UPI0015E70451|nr:hypothetical protein [Brevibacterium oceani]
MTPTPRALDDFDQIVRSALRDDAVWELLTSTPQGIADVDKWLKTTAGSIDQQLSFRKDEIESARLERRALSPTDLSEYHAWRKKAVFLKALCEKRLVDIRPLRIEAFGEDRARRMKALLVRLAEVVLDHEAEQIDDDLYDALDEIVLPGDDAPTLREYLERRAERAAA